MLAAYFAAPAPQTTVYYRELVARGWPRTVQLLVDNQSCLWMRLHPVVFLIEQFAATTNSVTLACSKLVRS